jgi:hypothetical protein
MFQFMYQRVSKIRLCPVQLHKWTAKGRNNFVNLTSEQEAIVNKLLPKPKPSSCCGNGCTECALVDYFKELEEYERQKNILVAQLFMSTSLPTDGETLSLKQRNVKSEIVLPKEYETSSK